MIVYFHWHTISQLWLKITFENEFIFYKPLAVCPKLRTWPFCVHDDKPTLEDCQISVGVMRLGLSQKLTASTPKEKRQTSEVEHFSFKQQRHYSSFVLNRSEIYPFFFHFERCVKKGHLHTKRNSIDELLNKEARRNLLQRFTND